MQTENNKSLICILVDKKYKFCYCATSRVSNWLHLKLKFANYLYLNQGMSMSDAKKHLNKTYDLNFSLTHVINLIDSL